jgi:hypothetical protein
MKHAYVRDCIAADIPQGNPPMTRLLGVATATLGIITMFLPEIAYADPPCGRGWRRHEYCGPYVYRPRVYVPPPPVYYAPPPVYYPPPPVYYAPPAYVAPPGISLGVNIPLR